uniref:Uncharacterized protein n=1 Tax=Anguilla anguilla TaxID=7936 RepID=A0A0E9VV35_ANGAN
MSLLILVSIFSCAAFVMYLVYRNFPDLTDFFLRFSCTAEVVAV